MAVTPNAFERQLQFWRGLLRDVNVRQPLFFSTPDVTLFYIPYLAPPPPAYQPSPLWIGASQSVESSESTTHAPIWSMYASLTSTPTDVRLLYTPSPPSSPSPPQGRNWMRMDKLAALFSILLALLGTIAGYLALKTSRAA